MSLSNYYELRTFNDIINAVIETLHVQSADQNTLNRIKRNINMIYTNTVASSSRSWSWLNQTIVLNTAPYYNSGTISVQQNVANITFSTPVPGSRKNWYINIEGATEVYQIFEHEDQGTTATLTTRFGGLTNTAARFRIWTDMLALPADCQNVRNIVSPHREEPLDPISLQMLRKYQAQGHNSVGKPEFYAEGPRMLPSPYEAFVGLANPVSRESSGFLKTLYFNQDPSVYIRVGDRIRVTSSVHYEYEGDIIVSAVDATSYFIQYTSRIPRYEANTAVTDLNEIEIYAIAEGQQDPYPTLIIHPPMDHCNHINTLVVDYQQSPEPLLNLMDEPRIPMQHRQVLFYGAMWLSCDRDTDRDRAIDYKNLMDQEVQRMIALTTLPMKTPKLEFSNDYVKSKGRMPRRRLIIY